MDLALAFQKDRRDAVAHQFRGERAALIAQRTKRAGEQHGGRQPVPVVAEQRRNVEVALPGFGADRIETMAVEPLACPVISRAGNSIIGADCRVIARATTGSISTIDGLPLERFLIGLNHKGIPVAAVF